MAGESENRQRGAVRLYRVECCTRRRDMLEDCREDDELPAQDAAPMEQAAVGVGSAGGETVAARELDGHPIETRKAFVKSQTMNIGGPDILLLDVGAR